MPPVTVLVTYKPKAGAADALEALLRKHGPALKGTGLITDKPVRTWKTIDKRGDGALPYYVEMFEWRDAEASDLAHQTPEVMSVWEPMGPILESIEIAHLDPLNG